VYSDLGFILLGFLAEDAAQRRLDAQFRRLWPRLAWEGPSGDQIRTAPTMPMPEDPRRGRLLVGEVHDNYAAALGGVAGHAGLFGPAAAVGEFGRTFLCGAVPGPDGHPLARDWTAAVTQRSAVPGSSRALGWDTMLPTSSCGTQMSLAAFGHVGFTGTSLWIDPLRDRYFVLLTNRACGGGTIEDMRAVRRRFHDALGDV
jgi:CubicO group peptidase (beta-lactamase class C family)